jgi:hypothetical protein
MVKERLTTIRKLQGGRGLPVLLLAHCCWAELAQTGLAEHHSFFNTSNDTATIQLSGSALANEDISDFVDKLQDSCILKTVRLLGVSPFEIGSRKYQEL